MSAAADITETATLALRVSETLRIEEARVFEHLKSYHAGGASYVHRMTITVDGNGKKIAKTRTARLARDESIRVLDHFRGLLVGFTYTMDDENLLFIVAHIQCGSIRGDGHLSWCRYRGGAWSDDSEAKEMLEKSTSHLADMVRALCNAMQLSGDTADIPPLDLGASASVHLESALTSVLTTVLTSVLGIVPVTIDPVLQSALLSSLASMLETHPTTLGEMVRALETALRETLMLPPRTTAQPTMEGEIDG
jgi:hypothetical protein